MEEEATIAAIQDRVGHKFNDPGWLVLALTHSSVGSANNEVLAWVGDRIHGLWAARSLLEARHGSSKGGLTEAAKQVVGETAQAAAFDALSLQSHLRVGGAITGAGTAITPSMKSTAFEALVAAIEEDGGRDAAEKFLHRQFDSVVSGLAAAR